jgi:hypothetical protein
MQSMRQSLGKVLADELENLPTLLASLEGKDRLDAILRLLPYLMPKPEPINQIAIENDLRGINNSFSFDVLKL